MTVEILWEISHGGTRPLRREDAVEILKDTPCSIPKTNVYRTLAASPRFAAQLGEDERGWLRFVS
jgi:hypothetical protein